MKDQISPKMDEFIHKVDQLCFEYGYEIWPTDKINARNEDGTYPTFTIHSKGQDGEKVKLIYIDGDGRSK